MTRTLAIVACLTLAATACGKNDEGKKNPQKPAAKAPKPAAKAPKPDQPPANGPGVKPGPAGDPAGLAVVTSTRPFDDTVKALKGAIEKSELAIVFEANHQNMMKMVGIESKPSVVIGFAKPEMGKMLMGKDPRLALEMPQRIAVRELDDGSVAVLYYTPSYLFAAYGKPPLVEMAKKKPDMMLAKLASAATGTEVKPQPGPAAPPEALVSVTSNNGFDDTVSKLKDAIKGKDLAIVFEANHQNMMKMVGIESKPSVAIGFAKPQMGAQAMKLDPRVALDMPLRIAVRELGDGSVVVLYYSPSFLFSHYGNDKLRMMAETKLDKMVAMLVAAATS